jgi:hypothetical protein
MNKNSNNLKKGFFKRVWDYLKTKRYERKLHIQQTYKADWNKVKWKYRITKLTFILGFGFCANALFNENVLNKNQQKLELNDLKDEICNFILNSDEDSLTFTSFIKKVAYYSQNMFSFKVFNDPTSEETMKNNSDVKLIVEEFKKLIDDNSLLSKLKVITVGKKYTEQELSEEEENVKRTMINSYKKYITGTYAKDKFILLNTNLIRETKSQEEMVFLIALTVNSYKFSQTLEQNIKKCFLDFIEKCCQKNSGIYKFSFNEDFKNISEDLKSLKDPVKVRHILIFKIKNFIR